MADIVIAVSRDADNNLTNLYTGYDFHAAKTTLAQANPHIGLVFRGDPSTAAQTCLRTSADQPPVTPSVQSAVMDGHSSALVPGDPYGPQLLPDVTPPADFTCTIRRVIMYESVLNGPPVPLDCRFNIFVSDNDGYPSPVQITDPSGILGNDVAGTTQSSPLIVPINSTGATIVLDRNQAGGAQPAIWLSMDVNPSNSASSPSIALEVTFNVF
jgi:hypothetical protein